MTIRPATTKDLPAISRLAKEMINYHHSLDRYYKPSGEYKNLENDLGEFVNDPDTVFLLAEENNQVIGYFRGAIEPAPEYADRKKIGVVYDLVVSSAHRQRGVGKKLFAEALERFRAKKIKNIELSVDARNAAAIKFWKILGFADYKLRLRLDLDK